MKAVHLSLLASVTALVALGSAWTIDWHTVDGGGGSSSGGDFEVIGTLAQPDASTTRMTGGPFTLEGGFWVFAAAIQTPGAPLLKLTASGPGQAAISWIPPTSGWVLQETTDLSMATWNDSPSGATNPVVVPTSLPKKFYRLTKVPTPAQ